MEREKPALITAFDRNSTTVGTKGADGKSEIINPTRADYIAGAKALGSGGPSLFRQK